MELQGVPERGGGGLQSGSQESYMPQLWELREPGKSWDLGRGTGAVGGMRPGMGAVQGAVGAGGKISLSIIFKEV